MKLAVDDLPLPPPETAPPVAPKRILTPLLTWVAAIFIGLIAVAVRVQPSAGFTGVGFDEALYRDYVIEIDKVGLSNFPLICQLYIQDQRQPATITKLPPTRFLYIFTSWVWKRAAFGNDDVAPPRVPRTPGFATSDPALVSLHRVACAFSILFVALTGLAAYRMLGRGAMLGVLTLVATSPTQIHMSQHALIDGFFAFWATLCLWLLWGNLRHPHRGSWLAAYAVGLALLVLTKENAFFVFVALSGLIIANRWAKFGTVTSKLVLVSIAGPLTGLAILVTLAGGMPHFVEIYQLLVGKAGQLAYAIKTGDGPWHRYLADMLIVSPIVLILGIGGLFTQLKKDRAYLYLALFVAFTYLLMCNVRYAMNLRYATVWELPLCALASAQASALCARWRKREALATAITFAALAAYGLHQYSIFFVDAGLYELVSEGLLRAVKILK